MYKAGTINKNKNKHAVWGHTIAIVNHGGGKVEEPRLGTVWEKRRVGVENPTNSRIRCRKT